MLIPKEVISDQAITIMHESLAMVPKRPWPISWWQRREADTLQKAVVASLERAKQPDVRVATQPSVVVDAWEAVGAYVQGGLHRGIRQKTQLSFDMMCDMASYCEPMTCIVNTGVKMGGRFAEHAPDIGGPKTESGWQVALVDEDAKPTAQDKKCMDEIKSFVEKCGFVEPPKSQRPLGWQPGFRSFMEQTIRNSLRMDWTTTRLWGSSINSEKYPIVSFAAEDARHIVFTDPAPKAVKRGVVQFDPYPSERQDTGPDVKYVKLQVTQVDGTPIEEYREGEMVSWIRNPRTDANAMGYGRSEAEDGVNMAAGWIFSRDTNLSRFQEDHIGKGFMVVPAATPQQLASFQMAWARHFSGEAKDRWRVPILSTLGGDKGTAQWVPMDTGQRDMEYPALTHMLGAIWHSLYGMSPQATGWADLNPKAPPLSEASPEELLDNGEDLFLTPLITWFFACLTRDIIWAIPEWRGRYRVVPVGLGDYNKLDDANLAGAQLSAGIATTMEIRAERSRPDLPLLQGEIKPTPFRLAFYAEVANLPGGWQNFQNVMSLIQMEQAMQQAAQQQQAEQQQAQQEQSRNAIMDSAQGQQAPPTAPPAGKPGAKVGKQSDKLAGPEDENKVQGPALDGAAVEAAHAAIAKAFSM